MKRPHSTGFIFLSNLFRVPAFNPFISLLCLISEEKAKLLRRVGGNVEEKDQELMLFLSSLQVQPQ